MQIISKRYKDKKGVEVVRIEFKPMAVCCDMTLDEACNFATGFLTYVKQKWKDSDYKLSKIINSEVIK